MISEGLERVTRVTIVTDSGIVYEDYAAYRGGIELSIQDEGRTLKVFPLKESCDTTDIDQILADLRRARKTVAAERRASKAID